MGGTIIYFKQLGIHKNKTTVSLIRQWDKGKEGAKEVKVAKGQSPTRNRGKEKDQGA